MDSEAIDAAPAPLQIHGFTVADSLGQQVIHVPRDAYVATVKALLADGYLQLTDLCAVDYLTHPGRTLPDDVAPERFEVVVNLLDHAHRRRLRIRVQIPAADATCPTLFDLHPGADAMEREAFDLMGITFTDHPDPSRILMPEDWEGHPLRKDYDAGAIPVQFSHDFALARGERGEPR
ncbi:MAG TPA: NADH-quinone oxidoreductase subunit C [Ilumatobacteraceae bacterium]|nr:NADH-quinone oxidoreductase subunit C [Ilumatobacteraceae bacterium]